LALNPDDLIARTNIARTTEGKQIDVRYLTRLSDDAVPALMEGFNALDRDSRSKIAKHLLQRKEHLADSDWRSWNWSSYIALRALAGREADLRVAAQL
jgi:hypothetical protein